MDDEETAGSSCKNLLLLNEKKSVTYKADAYRLSTLAGKAGKVSWWLQLIEAIIIYTADKEIEDNEED